MKSRFYCTCSLACMIALPAMSTSAELTLATDLQYFDYEEFGTNGQSLNQETGFIPGLRLAGSTHWLEIDHTIEIGAWGGTVDYDGRTQLGKPHQTDTDETIYRVRYRADWQPRDSDGSLYASAYWQNWDRDIQPANGVSGLFERYQWWSIEVGLRSTVWQQQNRSFAFEFGVIHTGSGTIMIDLSGEGFGKPELHLGNGPGASVGLDYIVRLGAEDKLGFSFSYQRWKFGRSNSTAVSNGVDTIVITEPDSVSNQLMLSASYVLLY